MMVRQSLGPLRSVRFESLDGLRQLPDRKARQPLHAITMSINVNIAVDRRLGFSHCIVYDRGFSCMHEQIGYVVYSIRVSGERDKS